MDYKGILIAIGGNEDKGFDTDERILPDFITAGILSQVVKESGGIDAKIIVIPTASSIPVEVGENYIEAFSTLGCTDVTVLNIKEKTQCEEAATIAHFETAACIMFSGGDQSRIVDIIGNTSLHKVLLKRFKEEAIVIAGTSAGAMAMSTEMVYGGSSQESLIKGSVLMRDGLGLIPKLIIDTHFIKRGRFGRLTEAVAKFPDLLGIGLAEDTGMVIRNRNEVEVLGSGMIIIFDPTDLTHNNEAILEANTPMTIANLRVHVLAQNDHFHINSRKVKAATLIHKV